MKSVFDLSFRIKLPLWGSLLIIATTLVVGGSLMARTYEDLQADLLSNSTHLSHKLAEALLRTMLEGDVWEAFEIINAPLVDTTIREVLLPKAIVVLDNQLEVFVSTRPKAFPLQAKILEIDPQYAALVKRISQSGGADAVSFDLQDAENIFVVTPIVNEGYRNGTVIVIHSKDVLMPRFLGIAQRGALVGLLVLALLLPINWYWGQRLSRPLVLIAGWMNSIDHTRTGASEQNVYPYEDEVGQLFSAYRRRLQEQQARAALEQRIIHSERLAAVGRLAAGVAHEINNPLGGMLTAIDTLKSHGKNSNRDFDSRTAKTISLIERGLTQIKETVGALLVEARIKSRALEEQDFEDIRNLVIHQAQKKLIDFDWRSNIVERLPLQANPVRQLLINLLLNAIQAAQQKGVVSCSIEANADELHLSVENDGMQMTPEQAEHLYEPFSPTSESGHGLGLWITYQIVQQLGGSIDLDRHNGLTRFSVILPFNESIPA
jgi:signal transduction histidine kinase